MHSPTTNNSDFLNIPYILLLAIFSITFRILNNTSARFLPANFKSSYHKALKKWCIYIKLVSALKLHISVSRKR
ncbi:hypothetical protein VCHA56P521_210055 [Vibrio chagasii]|nr:hypothetical protein VCHA36P168_160077 [Vibrio chagasii]CAH7062233.1 hypothetical protein VCHA52P461_170024 [Vibrio chagasii]CAH7313779.1 hypothetical protein VCHA37P203_210057 [Vibrio chagasii]CAH7331764.1 hypothetical protein VCHA56P521_210055 [Vibrio chagasii]